MHQHHESFVRAIRKVWSDIASDIFQAVADSGEGDGTMSQEEVIEVTMDAGRVDGELLGGGPREAWRALTYQEQLAIAKVALPDKTWSL